MFELLHKLWNELRVTIMEQGFPPDAPWRNQFVPILFQVILGGGVLASLVGVVCIRRPKSRPVGMWLLGLGIVAGTGAERNNIGGGERRCLPRIALCRLCVVCGVGLFPGNSSHIDLCVSFSLDRAVRSAAEQIRDHAGTPPAGRGQKQDITRDQEGRDYTDFLLVIGPGTISANNQAVRGADVRDGLSQTAFVTEASGQLVVWTEPRDLDVSRQPIGINLKGKGKIDSPGLMSSYHSNGAFMLMGDGKVKFVSEKIDPRVLKSLTTIDACDVIDDF
jgi:uncharacterized protein DUF1559